MAQLYELELNSIANDFKQEIKARWNEGDTNSMEYLLFDLVRDVNPRQAEELRAYYDALSTDDELTEFWRSIVEDGIYLCQPPFWGNVSLEKLREMLRDYGIKPKRFKGIEEPLVIGELYFMKSFGFPVGRPIGKTSLIAGTPTAQAGAISSQASLGRKVQRLPKPPARDKGVG